MRDLVRYIVILAVMGVTTLVVRAQDQAVYNHYISNQGILNPAYSGSRDAISGLLVFRSQWTGFKGAPYTGAVNVHGPITSIKALKDVGVGVVVSNDHLGFTNNFEFFAAGSYRLKLNNKTNLRLGLQVGFKNILYDGTKAIITHPNDPLFLKEKVSKFGFNTGFGAYLYTAKYFVGLSVPRFFTNKYNSNKQEIKNTVSFKDLHSYVYGGYVFDVNDIKIKPTALARVIPGAPLTMDISCSVKPIKNQELWVGFSYRTVSEAVILAEYQVGKIGSKKSNKKSSSTWGVRYSFDYSISDIRKYATVGSHEIGVFMDFTPKKSPGMRSIRYF
ncbi:MAG: PorP/SprF family type IX secretion system membrane protein [Bacteroidales bacterium]|nr:PorP/SprF family type IX secretion system membrane protein [Bacteroidales bacterium]